MMIKVGSKVRVSIDSFISSMAEVLEIIDEETVKIEYLGYKGILEREVKIKNITEFIELKNIIVFHTKHGNVHYPADTPSQITNACMKELKIRKAEGFFYLQEPPKKPTRTIEEAETLGDPEYVKHIKGKWNGYKAELDNYNVIKDQNELLDKALNGDRFAAIELVYSRKDFGYEGFTLEQICYPEGTEND